MSTYYYWCNQFATFVVETMGVMALLLLAFLLWNKLFDIALSTFKIKRLFIEWVWQRDRRGDRNS